MLHKNIFLVVQTAPFFQHGLDLKFNSKFNVLGGWTKPNNISTNDIHKYKEGDNGRLILEPCLSAHSLTLQVILNSPQNKLYLPANQKF
jgi:hypothetical protein